MEKEIKTKFKFSEDDIKEALVLLLKTKYKVDISDADDADLNFYDCLSTEYETICNGAILKIFSKESGD